MKYSLDKYKYYRFVNENGGITVTAASSYAGRTVKGYAKCDPQDEFNLDHGKELAAARCNERIAAKRMKRAENKVAEAEKQVAEAQAFLARMQSYYEDSVNEYNDAMFNVEALENAL